jgi:hypothetical protein
MPFTDEQYQKIKEALSPKLTLPCPSCGNRNWSLPIGFVMFPVLPHPTGDIVIGGQNYPTIPIICNICGNMQFFNVFMLGVADVLGVKRPEQVEGLTPPPKEEQNG